MDCNPGTEERPITCETCHSHLDWFKGYYGAYSKCSNHCIKCNKGCYNHCVCSKRRVECKECKFCDILVPLQTTICSKIYDSGCCETCKGDCDYICGICKKNCDTNCDCDIQCYFCENRFLKKDFLNEDGENRSQAYTSHGQTIGKATPMCYECGSKGCWCNEGTPCPTPCKECGATCDSGCGCICSECDCEMEEGGCKCYEEDKNLNASLTPQKGKEIKMADRTRFDIGIITEMRVYEVELDAAKRSGILSGTMSLSDYIVLKQQNVVVVPEPTVALPETTNVVVTPQPKKAYKQIYGKKPKEGEGLIRYCKDGLRIWYDEQPGWQGTFNAAENGIEHDGNLYYSLSGFASDYLKVERSDRVTKEVNGWTDCYYRDEEKSHMYPMDNLRKK